MALVAWAPKGMSVPMKLVAVKLPPGPVTERQWWEALADRVQELADKAGEQETMQACKALNVPQPEYLNQAGQSLVLHNLNLRTQMELAMPDKHPFPGVVTEPSQDVKDALNLDLMDWVEQALSVVSESDLD